LWFYLQHAQHPTGDDIDEFHPATPGKGCGANGGAYYREIAFAAATALQQQQQGQQGPALQPLVQWATATRAAINDLAAVTSPNKVVGMFHMNGWPVFLKHSLSARDRASWDAPSVSVVHVIKGKNTTVKGCLGESDSRAGSIDAVELLGTGWAEQFLTQGSYRQLTLPGLGRWNNKRRNIHFNLVHNDHLQIQLITVP
jgi:hypothetical protein